MTFERKIILVKLSGFLTGEISIKEIYEWALFVAVSHDYEGLIKNDPLVEKIIQFLVEINNERAKPVPTRKILEYYVECLEGTRKYTPEALDVIIADSVAKPAAAAAAAKLSEPTDTKPLGWQKYLDAAMKIYVMIFLVVSAFLNLVIVIKPDFLVRPGEISTPAVEVFHAALPHLFYAGAMMIAMTLRVPRVIFYGLFFISTGGMFFYWYTATDFVLRQNRSLIYLVPLLPFVALPPTCAFFIMLNRWFSESDGKLATPRPFSKGQ